MSDRHETSARTGSRRVVAIDVGGTTLRAGLLDTATELLGSPLEISSPTAESYEAILDTFEQLVRRAAAGRRAAAVGIAMPGPFDYADGVSRMRHKLGALYGHP
ncbi:MAG: ROK family protein, partial [Gaiellales bacterium]